MKTRRACANRVPDFFENHRSLPTNALPGETLPIMKAFLPAAAFFLTVSSVCLQAQGDIAHCRALYPEINHKESFFQKLAAVQVSERVFPGIGQGDCAHRNMHTTAGGKRSFFILNPGVSVQKVPKQPFRNPVATWLSTKTLALNGRARSGTPNA